MSARTDNIIASARQLYSAMPGSASVPYDPSTQETLWGEVENTDHWQFCLTIAMQIALAIETALEAKHERPRLARTRGNYREDEEDQE